MGRIRTSILNNSFVEEGLSIYMKVSGSSRAFIVLYVDDILIIGNDKTILESVKQWLCSFFLMNDFREAQYIL